MSEEKNKTDSINIDVPIFSNPFKTVDSKKVVENMVLYTSIFKKKVNQQYLKLIGDNEVCSTEECDDWTRKEILESLACRYGYRNKLTLVNRDILKTKYGFIVHQVNCQGVMGSGLAKSIKEKWPIVFENYKKIQVMRPGMVQTVRVNDTKEKYPLYVINLFGQDSYGRFGKFTEYFAVRSALKKIKKLREGKLMDIPIYFPYKIGCNRGGGDWNEYSKYILKYCPDAIICKLEGE